MVLPDRQDEDVRGLLLDPGPCGVEDGEGWRCLLTHGHDSDHFSERGWFNAGKAPLSGWREGTRAHPPAPGSKQGRLSGVAG